MAEKSRTAIDKINKTSSEKADKKNKSNTIYIVLLLFFFMVIGIGAGVLYGLGKSPDVVNKFKLYEYPLIGQFFPRPKTNFEMVDVVADNAPLPAPAALTPAAGIMAPQKNAAQNTPILPQDVELAKLQKAQQIETAKRMSKLARLYGSMKPEEAVPILSKLDDETVLSILGKMEEEQVSKLLPLFEAQRAANLTQMMLRGNINH